MPPTTKRRGMRRVNQQLIDGWLDWLATGNLSPATIRNRKYALAALARDLPLPEATTTDIVNHLAALPGGAWSKSGHLAAIRSFYRWANGTGACPTNPTLLIRSIKTHDRTRPTLPGDVLERALDTAPPRTRLMLMLGAFAGMRRAEIAAFHSSCIRGDVLVIVGKGSKERRIPIHPRLDAELDDLRAHPGWAFPSHYLPGHHITPESVQRAVTKALGEPWRTHDLRRWFATRAYDGTRDLRAVQELLGHADPATTSKYVAANADAMAAAVRSVA